MKTYIDLLMYYVREPILKYFLEMVNATFMVGERKLYD